MTELEFEKACRGSKAPITLEYPWNTDWRKGSTETAGFGFRGGSYYEHQRMYGNFSPHGPIGYRNLLPGPAARSIAYGSRLYGVNKELAIKNEK